jgi:hypothetical protein
MTMTEIQRRLTRAVNDMEAVAQELWARGLEDDWLRMEEAIGRTGQVCVAFLDPAKLESLHAISDCVRPAPGEPRADNVQVCANTQCGEAAIPCGR